MSLIVEQAIYEIKLLAEETEYKKRSGVYL